jgi:membrane-associated phospholipid phosphatase
MQKSRKLSACVLKLPLLCALFATSPNASVAQTTEASPQIPPPTAAADASLAPAPDTIQPAQQDTPRCSPSHVVLCLKDISLDQLGIWTSPLHLHSKDAFWLVPFAGATALAFHYDAQAQQQLGTGATQIRVSNDISRFGSSYATLGAGGALYFLGRFTQNDHLAETGWLGAEAVIDTTLVAEVLKTATNRQRPLEGNGTGRFWSDGTTTLSDSFPSGHAMQSWALARVMAAEYPSKLTEIGAYGLATAISVSRITAKKHFPSDVLVGSVFGYLIGGYVVRHHATRPLASGFSLMPLVDASTHTYGATIELIPADLHLARVGHLLVR